MAQDTMAPAMVRDGPAGVGGWLILPVIGMFLSPFRALTLFKDYAGLSEAMPYLDNAQRIFVIAETLGNVAFLLIMPVVLLILLFKHMALFPRAFIAWALGNLAFMVLDLIGAQMLFGDVLAQTNTPLFDAETTKGFGRSIFASLIWVPYMARSRRVRNTFVN